jgi:hypothetical protein
VCGGWDTLERQPDIFSYNYPRDEDGVWKVGRKGEDENVTNLAFTTMQGGLSMDHQLGTRVKKNYWTSSNGFFFSTSVSPVTFLFFLYSVRVFV